MGVAACFGLLSGLFAPKPYKFVVVSLWAFGIAVTSALQAYL